jgi:hypothetical protein
VTTALIDASASLPAWVYVAAWLGPGLLGQEILGPILASLVPLIGKLAAEYLLTGPVAGAGTALSGKGAQPSVENLVLVLDQVDIHEGGIQLSGRADAGVILASGRQGALAAQNVVALPTPAPVDLTFRWQPGPASVDLSSDARWAVIRDHAATRFWQATYDDFDPAALGRDSTTLAAGDTVMAWVEAPGGTAKVLFEWPAGALSAGVRITWILYQGRVHRAVTPVSNLVRTLVGGEQGIVADVARYTYAGTVELATVKAYFSDQTRALGEESWFWDGAPVTAQGLAIPGGTVLLDPVQRRLVVSLDQVALINDPVPPVDIHLVEFRGTDVFGDTLDGAGLVWAPPQVITAHPIAPPPPVFIDPLGDPVPGDSEVVPAPLADLVPALSRRLGATVAAQVVRVLTDATATGSATLGRQAALGIVSALAGLR